jgi:hypothetical protein
MSISSFGKYMLTRPEPDEEIKSSTEEQNNRWAQSTRPFLGV